MNRQEIKANFLLDFCTFMLNTLEALHERNIIHRDIKMANIMISENEDNYVFKLVDLGFACLIESEIFDLKFRRNLIGTPYYISPELIAGVINPESLKASDVWAFGITLYALSNMNMPFNATNAYSLFEKVEKNNRKTSECFNKCIQDITELCLAHKYEARSTAQELLKFMKTNENLVK